MTDQLHFSDFPGRIIFIGFGAIGQGVLPLILRHIGCPPERMTIVSAEEQGSEEAAAYGIKFEFATPPTVPRYESADPDNYVDIVPLKLPAEIPYLAPTQEWRTVWDSALDRKQLGESIGSRFAGAVTFYDRPNSSRQGKTKQKRHQLRKRGEATDFTIHAEAPTYDFIKNESCILYPEVTQGPYWYPPSELLQRDMVQDQVCALWSLINV